MSVHGRRHVFAPVVHVELRGVELRPARVFGFGAVLFDQVI
jgi:hypothetical protein